MPLSFGSDRKNCRRYPLRTPADGTEPYEEIPSDIQGSYTGVPYDSEDNMPVQDADDLQSAVKECGGEAVCLRLRRTTPSFVP